MKKCEWVSVAANESVGVCVCIGLRMVVLPIYSLPVGVRCRADGTGPAQSRGGHFGMSGGDVLFAEDTNYKQYPLSTATFVPEVSAADLKR